MGSNLGHGAFIGPTKTDVLVCWGFVRALENSCRQDEAEALSRVLQAYERIAQLVPRKE